MNKGRSQELHKEVVSVDTSKQEGRPTDITGRGKNSGRALDGKTYARKMPSQNQLGIHRQESTI